MFISLKEVSTGARGIQKSTPGITFYVWGPTSASVNLNYKRDRH